MRWLSELQATVLARTISGAAKGGAAGAAASLATGSAIICTAPAWLPLVGGGAVVALSTVALWSTVGSGIGAVCSGVNAYFRQSAQEQAFQDAFPQEEQKKERIFDEPVQ